MAKTIDERIVELRFDNTNFESNVKQSISTLDKLKTSLKLDKAADGLSKLGIAAKSVSFNAMSAGLDDVKMKFSALQIIGATALSRLTNAVITGGRKLTSAISQPLIQGGINRAMNIENARFMLTGLLKDADKVQAVMDDASKAVDGTAYSFDAAAKAASMFAASGIQAGDDMLGALKAVVGVSAQTNSDFSSIADIFTTVAGNGRLMGMQLTQLAGRGLNAAATLADYFREVKGQTNITETEIRDMVSKSKIDFKTFAEAMTWAFGENAEKANDTLNGVISNIKSAFSRIGAEFVAPLIKTKGPLVQFLNEVRTRVNEFKKAITGGTANPFSISDRFVKTVVGVLDELTAKLKKVDLSRTFRVMYNIVDALGYSFKFLGKVIEPVKNALSTMFPSGSAIEKITSDIKYFTKSLSISGETVVKIYNTFKGFFAIFDIARMAVVSFVKAILPMSGSLKDIASKILDTSSSLGEWIVKLRDFIKEDKTFDKIFANFGTKITDIKNRISDFITKVSNTKVSELITKMFSNVVKSATDARDKLSSMGIETVVQKIANGVSKAVKKVDELLTGISTKLGGVKGVFDKIGNFFAPVINRIGEALGKLGSGFKSAFGDASSIMSILNSGLLVALASQITNFLTQLNEANKAGTEFFKQGFLNNLTVFGQDTGRKINNLIWQTGNAFKKLQTTLDVQNLKQIAVAIGILAASMFVMASIDSDKLAATSAAMVTMMVELLGAMKALDSIVGEGGGMTAAKKDISFMAIKIAAAVLIMAGAMKTLSDIDPDRMSQSILALAAAMGIMVTAMVILAKKGDKVKSAGSMIAIATSMLVLSAALKILATMKPEDLAKSLLAMTTALGVMVGALVLLDKFSDPKTMLSAGAAMFVIANAMMVMSTAMIALSFVKPENLAKSVLALAGAMTIIVGAFVLLDKFSKPTTMLAGAAALLIAANAIAIISGAMVLMGAMSLGGIGKSLLALGGAIVILAVGLNAMNGTLVGSAALVVAATAIAILAPALALLGSIGLPGILVALVGLAGAFAVLGAAAALLAPLIPAILALAGSIALMGAGLALAGVGITAIATGIGALVAAIAGGASGIVAAIDFILTTILKFVPKVVNILDDLVKGIVSLLDDTILGIVDVIVQCAPAIVEGVLTVLAALLTSLDDHLPEILQKVIHIIIEILEAIRDNIEQFAVVATQAAIRFIAGILEGLAAGIGAIVDGVFKVAIALIDGLTDALDANWDKILDAIVRLGGTIVDKLVETLGMGVDLLIEVGGNLIGGLIKGIVGSIGNLVNKVKDVAGSVVDAAKDAFDINSPSKVFEKIGKYVGDGLALGIDESNGKVKKSSEKLAKTATNVAKNIAKSVNQNEGIFDEFAENTDKNGKKVKLSLEKAADAFVKFRDSVKDSLKSSIGYFEEFSVEAGDISGANLIANLQEQTKNIEQYAQNIKTLSLKGMNKSLLKYITDMGAKDAAAYAAALVKMTPKEIKKLNTAFNRRKKADSNAASIITTSFAIDNKSFKTYESKFKEYVPKITKVAKEMQTKISEVLNYSLDDDVKKTAKTMTYGGSVLKTFNNEYLKNTKNYKIGTKIVKESKKAIEAHAKALYKQSDYYDEDQANLKSLKDYQKDRKKALAKLEKEEKEAEKKKDKKKLKRIRDQKKQVKDDIKEVGQAIKDENKLVADHISEVYNSAFESIRASIADFVQSIPTDFDLGINLFGDAEESIEAQTANAKESLDSLYKQQESLQNEVKQLYLATDEASKATLVEKINELDKVNNSIAEQEDLLSSLSETANNFSADTILTKMERNVKAVEDWQSNLELLSGKGLASGLLQQIKDMGIEGADYVKAFLNMTNEEIARANASYNKTMSMNSDNLIKNWREKLDKTKDWGNGLIELSKMKLNDNLLAQIQSMGVDGGGYELMKQVLTMTPAQIQELNDTYGEALKVPDAVANQTMAAFAYNGAQACNSFINALAKLNEDGSDENQRYKDTIDQVNQIWADGCKSMGKDGAKKLKKAMIDSGEFKSKDFKNKGKNIGKAIVDGMAGGIKAATKEVTAAGSFLATAVESTVKKQLGIKSPSRVFAQIGKFVDQGFAKGVADNAALMTNSVENAANSTIDAINQIVEEGSEQPTIRPVMDLTEIQNGVDTINSMGSDLGVSSSYNFAKQTMDSFNASTGMNYTLEAINRLQATLDNMGAMRPNITENNTFNIEDATDPRAVANEVNVILQQQLERRSAVWA